MVNSGVTENHLFLLRTEIGMPYCSYGNEINKNL
nr:MAG TPA: hypothetical protein [Caudoviricetes sp.]